MLFRQTVHLGVTQGAARRQYLRAHACGHGVLMLNAGFLMLERRAHRKNFFTLLACNDTPRCEAATISRTFNVIDYRHSRISCSDKIGV
tara:strand:- start:136 stop:402 length:267 start_codon:yes stop_codon:yes gene_type:complete